MRDTDNFMIPDDEGYNKHYKPYWQEDMLKRESEGEVNTLTPLYLNQQALRKIG